MPQIICVDANIGAGKSTLLCQLADRGCTVLQEGVDSGAWGAFLTRFYANPARWALSLQMAIALDMARQHEKMSNMVEDIVFVERGPHSAMCFVQNSIQSGHMDKEEFKLYSEMNTVLGWKPDVLVVIDVDTETCLQRIKSRNRDGEHTIDHEYLRAIDVEYTKMIKNLKKEKMPIIQLDGRKTPSALADELLAALLT